jgi:hypothetical protein
MARDPSDDASLIDGRPFTSVPWIKPLSFYQRRETQPFSSVRFG